MLGTSDVPFQITYFYDSIVEIMTGNSEQAVMGQLVQSKYTEMRGLHFILYPPRQSLQCLLYRKVTIVFILNKNVFMHFVFRPVNNPPSL